MSEKIVPRRGMRFKHARSITMDSTPDNPVPREYVVTRVTRSTVYYRPPEYSRGGWYIARDRFHPVVKEIIEEEA
jgi:hypothetical protein